MKKPTQKALHQGIALFLSICLLPGVPIGAAGEVAAPAISAISASPPLSSGLEIPDDLGRVQTSFQGAGSKTVIYIKDAHDSLEAQENIAALVQGMVRDYGIPLVFEEGYEGRVPTDHYFSRLEDREIRRRVAHFFLDKLRLSAAEYAHITRTRPFELIGADDINLYLSNLAWYRKNAQGRERAGEMLAAMKEKLRQFIDRSFPSEMKAWIRLEQRFRTQQIPLADYLYRMAHSLIQKMKKAEDFCGQYPHVSALLKQMPAGSLPCESAVMVTAIKPEAVFREKRDIENAMAGAWLTTEDQQQAMRFYRGVEMLERVNRAEVIPEEYDFLRQELEALRTGEIGAFLSRVHQRDFILPRQWEETVSYSLQFYEISKARDQAMAAQLQSFFKDPGAQTAILVFGGFHEKGILDMLRRHQVSYHVVAPHFSGRDTAHAELYRKLMGEGFAGEIRNVIREAAPAEHLFALTAVNRLGEQDLKTAVSELGQAAGAYEGAWHLSLASPALEKVWRRTLESRLVRAETRQPERETFFSEQGDFQNVFYMDYEPGIFAHVSLRNTSKRRKAERRRGGDYSLRAFLRSGFEGMRVDIRGERNLSVKVSDKIEALQESAEMGGIEFDARLDGFSSGNGKSEEFRVNPVQLHSGRFIRDVIRTQTVDPIAGRDIREMEEQQGESIFPYFDPSEVRQVVHDGIEMQSVILRNKIQKGHYHLKLELLFPKDVLVEITGRKKPSLRITVPDGYKRTIFKVRMLSSHPVLTPYRDEDIFLEPILEMKEDLVKERQAWEEKMFTELARTQKRAKIELYLKTLLNLKRDFSDEGRRREVIETEDSLLAEELLLPKAPRLEQMSEYDFQTLPIFKQETFEESLRTLRFLFSKEVLLAGSWQYLSYFGRDSILSLRVLRDYLKPEVMERILQSVLDRVSERGEIAHEEDLRRVPDDPRRLDYRMIDGEYMFLTLVGDMMPLQNSSDKEKFWKRQPARSGKGIQNVEVLSRVVRNGLDQVRERAWVRLKNVDPDTGLGDPTGNWRDAMDSMARSYYPGDVNLEWVYAALQSILNIQSGLQEAGLSLNLPEGYVIDTELLDHWRGAHQDFLQRFDTKDERIQRLIDWYDTQLRAGGETTDLAIALAVRVLAADGETDFKQEFFAWRRRIKTEAPSQEEAPIVPSEVRKLVEVLAERFRKNENFDSHFHYYALGKNLMGENIAAVNGDYSTFAPLNRFLSPAELAMVLAPVLTPVEEGGLFWEDMGAVLTANPMLAGQWNFSPVRFQADDPIADVWDMLNVDKYHGMVMWMSMVNLMLSGLVDQAHRFFEEGDLDSLRTAVLAIGYLRGKMNKLGALKNQEVIAPQVDFKTGRVIAAPFADSVESNPMQLWNAASEIGVQMKLEELLQLIAADESLLQDYKKARGGDRGIARELRSWIQSRLRENSGLQRSEARFPGTIWNNDFARRYGLFTNSSTRLTQALNRVRQPYGVVMDLKVFGALSPQERHEYYALMSFYEKSRQVKFYFYASQQQALQSDLYDEVRLFAGDYSHVDLNVESPYFDFEGRKILHIMKEGITGELIRELGEKFDGFKNLFRVRYTRTGNQTGLLTSALLLLESGREDVFKEKGYFSEVLPSIAAEMTSFLEGYLHTAYSA